MRRLGLALILAALWPTPTRGVEHSVNIDAAFVPPRALLGTPFGLHVTITNRGTTPIQVPSERHLVLAMRWNIPATNGVLPPHGGVASTARVVPEPLGPGQTKLYALYPPDSPFFLPRLCQPGKYRFSLVVDMKPWLGEGAGWSAISPEADVEVVEPIGEDKAAYDYLLSPLSEGPPEPCPAEFAVTTRLRGELPQKFPTSTYAAYVIRRFTSEGLSWSSNGAIADSLKNGPAGITRNIPCPPSISPCVQLSEIGGLQALDWTAAWIDMVLRAHPDIWFADELRLRLALDEIAAGKVSLGASDLENLSASARPDIAEKAGQLLTLVKRKGLVK